MTRNEVIDLSTAIELTEAPHIHRQIRLGEARRGQSGVIASIDTSGVASSLAAAELENRLLEMGFVEGARVEILHQGAVGQDPIAVRVDNITVAIRRREAMAITVAC